MSIVYRSSSGEADLNLPVITSQPPEGSGNTFPCDESDDEDCDDQFSGSSNKRENPIPVSDSSNADKNQRTGETRTDTHNRLPQPEDAQVMSSSSVSLTASMSRLKDKEGPSNTTTTKPSAASMVASGSLQSTTASLRNLTTPSISRVSASVGSRRGASPSSRNEETELSGGGGGKEVSSTGDDGRGQHRSVASNVGLIVGVVIGVVLLLLVLTFALYKYRSRDEGTYKIDNRNYTYEVCSSRTEENGGSGGGGGGVYKLRSLKSKQKRKDVKEWYV